MDDHRYEKQEDCGDYGDDKVWEPYVEKDEDGNPTGFKGHDWKTDKEI